MCGGHDSDLASVGARLSLALRPVGPRPLIRGVLQMSTWLGGRVEIVTADITTLHVDVIVNAANPTLLGGGGVDGAIHRAAGPELLEECRTLGGARPGEVKMTRAYRLPAKAIAHAVGPVWRGGGHGEAEFLASCYRRTLELVEERGFRTVAFPCISTGAYGYPIEQAARVAQKTVRDYLLSTSAPIHVIFCCYTERDTRVYERVAAELLAEP